MSSCKSPSTQKKNISDVSNVFLHPQPLEISNKYPGIYAIYTYGKNLILQSKAEYFFTVIDTAFNEKGQFCRRGNGHNEFIAPMLMNCVTTPQVIEKTNNSIYSVNPSDNYAITHQQTLAYDIPNISWLHKTKSQAYIGYTLGYGKGTFYCSKDCDVKSIDSGLSISEALPEYKFLSQSVSACSPDGSIVVSAYFHFPICVIYDSEGNIVANLTFKDYAIDNYSDIDILPENFRDVCITDKYIYLLHQDNDDDTSTSNVYRLSYDGQLISHYIIPSAVAIAATENDSTLYAINADDKFTVCNVYSMPCEE